MLGQKHAKEGQEVLDFKVLMPRLTRIGSILIIIQNRLFKV